MSWVHTLKHNIGVSHNNRALGHLGIYGALQRHSRGVRVKGSMGSMLRNSHLKFRVGGLRSPSEGALLMEM